MDSITMAVSRVDKSGFVIEIPNSEAAIGSQRVGIKDRTVGQYYLSNQAEEIGELLSGMALQSFIDFGASYLHMRDFITKLSLIGVDRLYKNGFVAIENSLKTIERIGNSLSNLLMFKIENPRVSLSRKYLKMSSRKEFFRVFSNLVLGDITEIVFEKLNNNTLRIFVRPAYKCSSIDNYDGFLTFFSGLR